MRKYRIKYEIKGTGYLAFTANNEVAFRRCNQCKRKYC